MKNKIMHTVALVLLIFFISGCAGYNRALLVTKTNVGIDIDTTPPTAEVTIARREIAIQPIFPDYLSNKADSNAAAMTPPSPPNPQEYALPLVAAFAKLDKGGLFNPEISGYFAGGEAAIHIVQENAPASPTPDPASSPTTLSSGDNSSICLQNEPYDMRSPLQKFWDYIRSKDSEDAKKAARAESRPFYFATDTSTGLKVAWHGTGGPYPDSFKLGYNRKEFASPPVLVNNIKGGCQGNPDYPWQVKLPSFVAAVSVAANIGIGDDAAKSGSSLSHFQFFATGKAATAFAQRRDVRQLIGDTIIKINDPASSTEQSSTISRETLTTLEKSINK